MSKLLGSFYFFGLKMKIKVKGTKEKTKISLLPVVAEI